jgi:hypothetical protein
MQGLPCEHCFAVLVIKKQAKSMPDCFLKNTCWHIESDETESQFQLWCMQMLSMNRAAPQPVVPNSTARSRYNGLMLTAKTMVSGYSLTVSDTDYLEDQMVQMCLGLQKRHAAKQEAVVQTLTSASLAQRKCSVCLLPGHRNDNAKLCTKHKDFKPSAVVNVAPPSFVSLPLRIGSLLAAQTPDALPVQDVQLSAQLPAAVVGAAALPEQGVQLSLQSPAAAATVSARDFGSPVGLSSFSENYDQFDARLSRSNLFLWHVVRSKANSPDTRNKGRSVETPNKQNNNCQINIHSESQSEWNKTR